MSIKNLSYTMNWGLGIYGCDFENGKFQINKIKMMNHVWKIYITFTDESIWENSIILV